MTKDEARKNIRRRSGPEWVTGYQNEHVIAEVYLSAKEFVRINTSWYEEFGSDEQKEEFARIVARVKEDGGDWSVGELVDDGEDDEAE